MSDIFNSVASSIVVTKTQFLFSELDPTIIGRHR